MVTRCKCCNKILALNPTAWASRDGMYCSETCGINDAKKLYKRDEYTGELDLKLKAKAYFSDIAEEISREEYGARVEHHSMYNLEYDITTIFEQVYEGEELISMTVVGWYYGSPSAENDEEYVGKPQAIFVEE